MAGGNLMRAHDNKWQKKLLLILFIIAVMLAMVLSGIRVYGLSVQQV